MALHSAETFNDLLVHAGFKLADVRLLRHHTKPGLEGRSLFDLWRDDRAGFELYQSTQRADEKRFRTGKYWAAFVSPQPGSAMFVGLYDAALIDTRRVEWTCPYRGDAPGGGAPVDVFETKLRHELAEYVGKLRVDWDVRSVRTWARYAQDADFPIVGAHEAAPARPEYALVETVEHIAANLGRLETIRRAGEGSKFASYRGFIERGKCLVPYTVDGTLAFAPSRLLGYRDNDIERHAGNADKHGNLTNDAITAIFGHAPAPDENLERSFDAFCHSLGLKELPRPLFGQGRRYWRPILYDAPLPQLRATPAKHLFEVGALYRRDEVAALLNLPLKRRGGAWMTGYTRIDDEFFLFANIGSSGRTGHDYANRWDGTELLWFGKSGTTQEQPEMRALLDGDCPVHVFWRGADRAPFTYAGLGIPLETRGERPVEVRWTVLPAAVVPEKGTGASRAWRRGPPPTAGQRTTELLEGPTSVYLLVLEGPVDAAFPDLAAGRVIIKIGMSNDVDRRHRQLSSGFPPGCALRWRVHASRLLSNAADAYRVETALLERLRFSGEWIGGEFAAITEAALHELAGLK